MRPFSPELLSWFDQHGRKDLPWQTAENQADTLSTGVNVYYTWLSEIMLQQTQVATVIDYFNRFIHHFPTIASLASASEDAVLEQWSGLGYYARARNLHKSAQIIIDTYQGIFPDSFDDIVNLPGIGRSTAGAILSIGFNQSHAILDGNVKRVLARYHQVQGHYGQSKTVNKLWELAELHTPNNRNNHYTQAIMDLGATVCTRNNPNCKSCPISTQCLSNINQTQSAYPNSKPKKIKPTRSIAMLIFIHNNQVYLEKRPDSGIWGGLWSFIECQNSNKVIQQSIKKFGQPCAKTKNLDKFKHTFTHYHLHIHPIVIECLSTTDGFFPIKQPGVGLPKPVAKILSQLTANSRYSVA